ncbi:MAG: TetM/TetW/TetO/TetS family tetracycline resistance ribosomal protection protein [Oscillospiraceae bacterium]|nr:TetM/TetW/TetO/TetS family tetracycline resistance ribosomal protection protein [Oscillospiraceae bacterium]
MSTSIGVFAHVDAGKTTLCEQILYRCGTLRSAGRVDDKNAYLDYNLQERQRGITIFSDQASFAYNGQNYTLVDTPGHIDFGSEMERSISACAAAVVVISAVDGIQSHTGTVFQLLKKQGVPTVLFFNKCDRDIADPKAVQKQVAAKWGAAPVDFTGFDGNVTFDLAEQAAECSEQLLDLFLAEDFGENFVQQLKKSVQNGELLPFVRGSALKGEGVDDLLKVLGALYAQTPPADAPLKAAVYKVRHIDGNRLTFLRILQGSLKPKQTILCGDGEQKVNEIRLYSGQKYTSASQVQAGDLCAVCGLTGVYPGDIVGSEFVRGGSGQLCPVLSCGVKATDNTPTVKLLQALGQIYDEDNSLKPDCPPGSDEVQISFMGDIQLEVLKEMLKDRYEIAVQFTEGEVLYRETIAAPVVGCGHFEPLRHYAEVHLQLDPAPRGSGIGFRSACHVDDLSLNWQRLIETHVFEKEHLGVLTGSPITDITVTLLSGRDHLKHTEGGDFRQSTYRAIRQGLMKAQNVLLEPLYRFEMRLPIALSGRALTDVAAMQGSCDTPVTEGETCMITGTCPVRTMKNYSRELVAYTHGEGQISLLFGGYAPCGDQENIVAQKGYNAAADTENPPHSVFCSHGAGFAVPWQEADQMMHLPVEKVKPL